MKMLVHVVALSLLATSCLSVVGDDSDGGSTGGGGGTNTGGGSSNTGGGGSNTGGGGSNTGGGSSNTGGGGSNTGGGGSNTGGGGSNTGGGGSSSTGGGGGTNSDAGTQQTCDELVDAFFIAIAHARTCYPTLPVVQCTSKRVLYLGCTECTTFVEDPTELDRLSNQYAAQTCPARSCPIVCPAPTSGQCASTGICNDVN